MMARLERNQVEAGAGEGGAGRRLMSPRAIPEWWSPAALAEMRLIDMPASVRNINDMAEREGWRRPGYEFPANPNGVWRKREGRGGGFEYRIDVLRSTTKADLLLRAMRTSAMPRHAKDSRHAELWAWFDTLPDRKKAKARAKLDALLSVDAMATAGEERDIAMQRVASCAGVSLRTLYNWQAEVRGKARADWLPHLAPRHFGSVRRSECSEAAFEWYKAQYLRQEAPSHAESYRLLRQVAAREGWTIPSAKTLERRIDELPKTTITLFRKGPEALKRLFPAQERDRGAFHALEAVNADGHTWDVFVRWFDGTVLRPSMVAFQDLHSGKILAWRFDKAPNRDIVRLAFRDVVEDHGVPDHCVLDNGRDFASKWITGGTPTRYRFKVRDEEPLGILPALGVKVHWTQPYHGQAKPIERAFRDFCMSIAKHPRFAGAWTGNTVANKPENYGSKAVPVAEFIEFVSAGIAEHNARLGRRTRVCGGRLSFDQVFAASYAASPIRQASAAQKRMLLLAPELVTARKPDGAVYVADNRYWAEFLTDQIGRKVILRLDPQNLHAGVHVERADGAYLGFAPCIEAVGFLDADKARDHARAKRDWLKAQKALARAQKSMSIEEVAALMPAVAAGEPTEAKVVRPLFGAKGHAALGVEVDAEEERASMPAEIVSFVGRLAAPRKRSGADG